MVNPLANVGQYSKTIVAFIGTISTGLTTEFPSAHWVPIVITALGALAVYLVPNQSTAAVA